MTLPAGISSGGKNNVAIDVESDLPLVMADRRRIVQVLGVRERS